LEGISAFTSDNYHRALAKETDGDFQKFIN
jgi:hypothetical protein